MTAVDSVNLAIIESRAKHLKDEITIIMGASEDTEWFDDQEEMRFGMIQAAAIRCEQMAAEMIEYAQRNRAQSRL